MSTSTTADARSGSSERTGGAAAARAAALAAGLVELVGRVSDVGDLRERAAAARTKLEHLARADGEAYDRVLDAGRRGEDLLPALSAAADPPVEIAAAARDVAELAARGAAEGKATVRGDAVTAALLAEAAARAAAELVEINLVRLPEDLRVAGARELAQAAAAARERALATRET